MPSPIRILTAVPICDGHDSAINTINLEFIRQGIEVIYLGYHRSVGDIVRAAIQEDVRAIGISSYNGGHIEFFAEVVDLLRKKGADDIKVFGGGGGTITHEDAAIMKRKGVDEVFFAGTSLEEMVKFVHQRYGKPRTKRRRAKSSDQQLAHNLTEIEQAFASGRKRRTSNAQRRTSKSETRVVGFTGPGGAGKTTLIDELVLRFLNRNPKGRIAILSHDPSVVGQGFQENGTVDMTVLVMNPDYGSRLQLQKIAMLDLADIVVVNKSDLQRARTAHTEIEQRLEQNRRSQQLIDTVAKRHRDPGVDRLFDLISKESVASVSDRRSKEKRLSQSAATAKRRKK